MALSIGARLGPYEILFALGAGTAKAAPYDVGDAPYDVGDAPYARRRSQRRAPL